MDDAASRRHPQHVSRFQRSLVAVAQLAFHDEGHRLESAVRVRATRRAARLEIDAIIHQHDEWIVARKIICVEHAHRGVSFADESW